MEFVWSTDSIRIRYPLTFVPFTLPFGRKSCHTHEIPSVFLSLRNLKYLEIVSISSKL